MKPLIHRLEEGLLAFLLAIMTLLVFLEVILRFGFNTGFMWAQELTLLISAWMVLLGASYGLRMGAHLGVDALVRLFPLKIQRIVGIFGVLCCLAYCGIFLFGSWKYTRKMMMLGIHLEDLAMPRWLAHSALIFCFALLALRLVQLLISIIQGKSVGFKLHTELKEVQGLYEAKDASGAVVKPEEEEA